MKLIIVLMVMLLAGCATNTGVVSIGKDTYMISGSGKSPGGYSGGEVKSDIIKIAAEYCRKDKKALQISRSMQNNMSFGINASAEIYFMCLPENDPEYKRPVFNKEPDTVVEIQK
jgi:predicted small secreted protein